MSRTANRLSESEREERQRANRERIERAAHELQSTEGWQRWVAIRRQNGLGRYSLHNQLLIASEGWSRGFTPSYVAGYRWWAEHGYQVRRGERGLRILAPVRRRIEEAQSGEERMAIAGFRRVSVFDRSQVEAGPEAVALEPDTQPIEGDSHSAHLTPLVAFLEARGLMVRFERIDRGGARGFFRPDTREIAVESSVPPNAQLRTLLHEAAHALIAERPENGSAEALTYAEEEVVVEIAGHVAAAALGLDTSGEAVPYVAGWGEHDQLQAVQRAAGLIDQVARELEDAAVLVPEASAH